MKGGSLLDFRSIVCLLSLFLKAQGWLVFENKSKKLTIQEMSSSNSKDMDPSFKSYCKSSNEMYCYSSPSPDEYKLSNAQGNKKMICSPPHIMHRKQPVLSPGSVNAQLKSGRSLLNSKPCAVVRMLDFHSGIDECDGQEMMLSPPAYPHYLALSSPCEATIADKAEEDMPVMVTPIKLKMRPSKNYHEDEPTVKSTADTFASCAGCLFAPIRSIDQDEESCA